MNRDPLAVPALSGGVKAMLSSTSGSEKADTSSRRKAAASRAASAGSSGGQRRDFTAPGTGAFPNRISRRTGCMP